MKFGRYEILCEIGRGSMGIVYQAQDPQIDRLVAVKVLRHDRVSSDAFVNRFLKEAKVIGRLSHPNIVTIYDVGEEQGNIFIAMELLEGLSLSDFLRKRNFSPKEVVELGVQITETLDYAHGKGVVHRDIKPSNIIVTPDGRIKITDFGIAHIEDSSATYQTQAGEILGTPAYMSPEQITGQPVDGRTDIFSLGIILYEMITGKRPFGGEGKTLATVFNDIMQRTPQDPIKISSSVPERLSGLIMKALQKEPEKRFQTGRELASALKECLHSDVSASDEKIQTGGQHKNYVIPFAVTIAVLILIAGIYYSYQYMNGADQQPAQESPLTNTETVSAANPKLVTNGTDKKEKAPPPHAVQGQKRPAPTRDIEAKKRAPIPEDPKPATILVPLTLRSAPQGASVYIDDRFKGKTPVTLMISTGEHQVRLTLRGYEQTERRIIVDETMEYPLTFNLKTVSGSGE
ncbi:MAG TPA: serine/threonine-protein kinase [Nitrospirota bacterium]|nr:serine/threonine-protein kinase [Nitrospirota bacterium]